MAADFPSRLEIVPWGAWEHVSSGVPTRYNNSGYFDLGIIYPASPAINAEIGWKVLLKSGTWSIVVVHGTSTDRPIYTAKLDTTTVGTFDGYSASLVVNVVSTIASIAVGTSGVYTLKFVTASKNASSTNYAYDMKHITLLRTGA